MQPGCLRWTATASSGYDSSAERFVLGHDTGENIAFATIVQHDTSTDIIYKVRPVVCALYCISLSPPSCHFCVSTAGPNLVPEWERPMPSIGDRKHPSTAEQHFNSSGKTQLPSKPLASTCWTARCHLRDYGLVVQPPDYCAVVNGVIVVYNSSWSSPTKWSLPHGTIILLL